MEGLFSEILSMIDILYIVVCNAASYVILSVYESINGKASMKVWEKRIASAITAILLGFAFVYAFNHNIEAVTAGFFIQFLCYDYLLKPVVRKLQEKIGNH